MEHDKSMDHPWMQMIYKQVFSLKQYATWLALNQAIFKGMEETLGGEVSCFGEISFLPGQRRMNPVVGIKDQPFSFDSKLFYRLALGG